MPLKLPTIIQLYTYAITVAPFDIISSKATKQKINIKLPIFHSAHTKDL